jgi:hypothetical protein
VPPTRVRAFYAFFASFVINNLPFISTTLSLYDLSDVYPAKLHMTVPTDFRRNSDIPGILVLHYADVPEGDVQTAQGYK